MNKMAASQDGKRTVGKKYIIACDGKFCLPLAVSKSSTAWAAVGYTNSPKLTSHRYMAGT